MFLTKFLKPKQRKESGFAAFFIVILILSALLGIVASSTILILGEEKISRNITMSNQAFYIAEAGVEDILLRLVKGMNWSTPYTLNVTEGATTIEISDIVGGSRAISSQGALKDRIRKVQIVYQITTEELSFHYGAQVGRGGMIMGPNSKVIGNVFSNGSVICPDPTGQAFVTNSITVAQNGKKIERLEIGTSGLPLDEARVHTCSTSTIHGDLYYVSGGSPGDCSADEETKELPNEIEEEPLPITDEQIANWKNDASCDNNSSCIYNGDYTIGSGETETLGPLKIIGNLILENNATLIMFGTIYVTATSTLNNGSTVKLDPLYGGLSGLIITDGKINVENNAIIQGSGQEGSYTMLLSTDLSLDENNAAIDVKNSAEGAIFYTTGGVIRLRNNMEIREAAGYKIYLDNNAKIEYETGLESADFTGGPGGAWQVTSWQEVE